MSSLYKRTFAVDMYRQFHNIEMIGFCLNMCLMYLMCKSITLVLTHLTRSQSNPYIADKQKNRVNNTIKREASKQLYLSRAPSLRWWSSSDYMTLIWEMPPSKSIDANRFHAFTEFAERTKSLPICEWIMGLKIKFNNITFIRVCPVGVCWKHRCHSAELVFRFIDPRKV